MGHAVTPETPGVAPSTRDAFVVALLRLTLPIAAPAVEAWGGAFSGLPRGAEALGRVLGLKASAASGTKQQVCVRRGFPPFIFKKAAGP